MMNKAAKAIIAIVIICGAIYYLYAKLVELHYIGGNPTPAAQPQQMMAPEGRPIPPAGAPAAPAQPAPSTDTTTTSQ